MSVAKILVVEDEVITAIVIAEELASLGYIVTDTATSDTEVIASVRANMPDLVLMDIVLRNSDLDGVAIALILRQEFQLPIIYITAHSDLATLGRAKRAEPFGYLVKPFDERDLHVAIETALYKHQIEKQLAQREEMLSTILSSTSDAVIATDRIARVTYMNPAAETLTGYSQSEALGQRITEIVKFVNEISGEGVANPVLAVLQFGQAVYLDDYIAIVDKHGIKKPVRDSASPLRKAAVLTDDVDGVDGVVLVLWDMSDRRKVEALEVEKAKISQALALEKETNELKSRIMAMASHEIRTPLASILLATDALERPDLPIGKRRGRLAMIRQSIQQVTHTCEDMLTLGRFEVGSVNYQPIFLNLEQVCSNLIADFKSSLEKYPNQEKPLVLSFSSRGSCERVCIDEDLVHYILTNLLSNAIKYSPNGGNVNLEVICEFQAKGNGNPENILSQILFRIRDEGIGIPAADLPFLFKPFQRASNVGKISGTGLGLAIVKRAVEMHGGQITVKSEIGQGTIFTVLLMAEY